MAISLGILTQHFQTNRLVCGFMFIILNSEVVILATYQSVGFAQGLCFFATGQGTCPLSCSRAGGPHVSSDLIGDLTVDDG